MCRKERPKRGPRRVRIAITTNRGVVSGQAGCLSFEDESVNGAEKAQCHRRVGGLGRVPPENVPRRPTCLDIRADALQKRRVEGRPEPRTAVCLHAQASE